MIMKVAEDFAQKGISIFSMKENFMTLQDDGSWNPIAQFGLGIYATVAQSELNTIRERSLSGKKHKMLSGELDYTFKAPYGYSKNKGKLVVNEEEAEQVRKMFDLFV